MSKIKVKILIASVFLIMLSFTRCDSARMKDYYTTHKNSLLEIKAQSAALADEYEFLAIAIQKKRNQLEVVFQGGTVDNVTMYLNPEELTLIAEYPVPGCSEMYLQRFRTMRESTMLTEILRLFEAIEPDAIKIGPAGVFVALGGTLRSPNPNLAGGILMTFEPELGNSGIVEKIDTNVYLYDDLIY